MRLLVVNRIWCITSLCQKTLILQITFRGTRINIGKSGLPPRDPKAVTWLDPILRVHASTIDIVHVVEGFGLKGERPGEDSRRHRQLIHLISDAHHRL